MGSTTGGNMNAHAYLLATGARRMRDLVAIAMLIRGSYTVIERGQMPNGGGLTFITASAITPDDIEAYGLVPLEDL